ncbi:MAG: flagellar protein FlgN [Verrucomicrobiota bacterium]|nr:flagellar protein FlgN [Opitutales bacterium]
MTISWEFIADCLRQELADYGGLLHLFEQQQRRLFERDPHAVMSLGGVIEEQARSVAGCRLRREQAVASLAMELGQPRQSTLRSLLPHIERSARPLLEALIGEVNALLFRVRLISRHNHTLLTRAVEVHQEVLQQLRPNSFTKTYSPAGRVSVTSAQAASTLCVAG